MEKTSTPAVKTSVIIPCRAGSAPNQLIEDLLRQTEVDCEILIVENPRHEPTLNERFLLDSRVRFFAAHPAGANRARQMGVRYAKGDLFVFVDDDVRIPDSGWLYRHVQFHQRHPEMLAIGGGYQIPHSLNRWGQAYHDLQEKWLNSYLQPGNKAIHLFGGNWSIKRRAFDLYKFDVELIFGGTETELQLQFWRSGEQMLFASDLAVLHGEDLSLFRFLKKGFAQGLGFAYLQKRYQRPGKIVSYSDLRTRRTRPEIIYNLAFQAGELFHKQTGAMTFCDRDVAFGFANSCARRVRTRVRRFHNRLRTLWFNLGQL